MLVWVAWKSITDETHTCFTRMSAGPSASFHRCPRGGYQPLGDQRLDRVAKLNDWQRDRLAEGWAVPAHWHRAGENYRRTGVATWCSSVTVKPPECRADRLATLGSGDRIFHHTLPSGRPGFPVRSVYGSKIELVHNYKVASSALDAYLSCEFGEEGDGDFAVSVFAVRDPIDRFVSAVGEVLQRFLNNQFPNGPCSEAIRRADVKTGAGASRSTAWRRVADAAQLNLTADVLPALVAAFVDDASCCHSGYALDHLQPQSAFATYAQRGIDVLIRYDALEEGIDELARLLNIPWMSPATLPDGRRKCALRQLNDAASRPPNIPSAAALRAALDAQPRLIRRLCDVYHQDFECFGLPRPAVCAAATAETATNAEPTEARLRRIESDGVATYETADAERVACVNVTSKLAMAVLGTTWRWADATGKFAFHEAGSLVTPWGPGRWSVAGAEQRAIGAPPQCLPPAECISAKFGGQTHHLNFSDLLDAFTSVRVGDGDEVRGERVVADDERRAKRRRAGGKDAVAFFRRNSICVPPGTSRAAAALITEDSWMGRSVAWAGSAVELTNLAEPSCEPAGSCSDGNGGMWPLGGPQHGGTERGGLLQCAVRCLDCERCSWVAYSARRRCCVWLSRCDGVVQYSPARMPYSSHGYDPDLHTYSVMRVREGGVPTAAAVALRDNERELQRHYERHPDSCSMTPLQEAASTAGADPPLHTFGPAGVAAHEGTIRDALRWCTNDTAAIVSTRRHAVNPMARMVRHVVVLLDRPDRQRIFLKNRKEGLKELEAFPAVNGYNESELLRAWRDAGVRYRDVELHNKGTIANWLSKFLAVRWQCRERVPFMALLEDDVQVINSAAYRALTCTLAHRMAVGDIPHAMNLDQWGNAYLFDVKWACAAAAHLCRTGMASNIDNALNSFIGVPARERGGAAQYQIIRNLVRAGGGHSAHTSAGFDSLAGRMRKESMAWPACEVCPGGSCND